MFLRIRMSNRTSSRANKGQHSVRFGAEPDIPAPQSARQPRKRRQAAAPANGAIPAVVVQNGVANIPVNNNRRKDDKEILQQAYIGIHIFIPQMML